MLKNKMPEYTLRGILKKKDLLLAKAEMGGRMKSKKNIREGRHRGERYPVFDTGQF